MVFCTACGSELEEQWVVCPNCGASFKKINEPEQRVITPQQEIMIPQQTSNEKRLIKKRKKLVIIGIIIALVGGFFIGTTVATLTGTIPISEKYDELSRNYWDLNGEYDALVDDYNELLNEYNFLFGQYQSILSVLENPLTNPNIPTMSQVQSWLSNDNTDTFNYTGNWMCGDFAAMLMVRAKAMNWRMRIACMFWSHDGDSGWQDSFDPYGSYGHAFNLIYCQDGDDLDTDLDIYYIEPQTDRIWYVVIGGIPHIHYEIWLTFTGGLSGTVWTEPYYINHYSYFA